MPVLNFMAINPFHSKTQTSTCWWRYRKNQGISKVSRIPRGTMAEKTVCCSCILWSAVSVGVFKHMSQVPQNTERVTLLVLTSQHVPQLLLRSFKVFFFFSDWTLLLVSIHHFLAHYMPMSCGHLLSDSHLMGMHSDNFADVTRRPGYCAVDIKRLLESSSTSQSSMSGQEGLQRHIWEGHLGKPDTFKMCLFSY